MDDCETLEERVEKAIEVFRELEESNSEAGNGEASGAYWDAANFIESEVLQNE
jgi:hypothetical protein